MKGNTDNIDSNKLFFTSDTHFNHAKIIDLCRRPFDSVEEMNHVLIENWNKAVPKDGVVFHLGDFAFGGLKAIEEIVPKLNGKIYLVRGNHDLRERWIRQNQLFEWIGDQIQINIDGQAIYLNHFPFLSYGGENKGVWQLFGHIHSQPNNNPYALALKDTQYDVGVDNNNYTPISFNQVEDIICYHGLNLKQNLPPIK